MARNMPEPLEFGSLDNSRRRVLWADKKLDLAPRKVVGLVVQAGDAEKFPRAFGSESLDPFLRVSKQDPCFTAIEETGDNKTLAQLELACEADDGASLEPGACR